MRSTDTKRHGPVLYCGDPHGRFSHIVEAAARTQASAVVLLGDLEPDRPLEDVLAPIVDKVWWIPGNHDTDSDDAWRRVWQSGLAGRNVHSRVVTLPDGTRLAGLGGVFRESVWYPSSSAARSGAPAFRSRHEHARRMPSNLRWEGGPERRHWSSIYPQELDRLADLRADILITHEAPGYHPKGFELLDTLAQMMGVVLTVHGHHHDRLDSSGRWAQQGFKSFGVGFRGISAIDLQGTVQVIATGDFDDAGGGAYRTTWP